MIMTKNQFALDKPPKRKKQENLKSNGFSKIRNGLPSQRIYRTKVDIHDFGSILVRKAFKKQTVNHLLLSDGKVI